MSLLDTARTGAHVSLACGIAAVSLGGAAPFTPPFVEGPLERIAVETGMFGLVVGAGALLLALGTLIMEGTDEDPS